MINDFTSVCATRDDYEFVRHHFRDLQEIIDELPELIENQSLISRINFNEQVINNGNYGLKNYVTDIGLIENKGILEVLYAHYSFVIAAAFRALGEGSNSSHPNKAKIPNNLANPISVIANKLNVPPVLTYHSHLILNWDHEQKMPIRRFSAQSKLNKSNLLRDFEAGFLEVHINIEKRSNSIIKLLSSIIDAPRINCTDIQNKMASNFYLLSIELNAIIEELKSIYNKCSPAEFNQYVRIFLGPYDQIRISGNQVTSLPGPSAAQSPTLLLFNYIFKANHSPNHNLSSVLKSAITAIPKERLQFIENTALQLRSKLDFIKSNKDSFKAYIDLYVGYLEFLIEHFHIVYNYLISPQLCLEQDTMTDNKGTGTSIPSDLSLRLTLIYEDILNLHAEYTCIHGETYHLKRMEYLNSLLYSGTVKR